MRNLRNAVPTCSSGTYRTLSTCAGLNLQVFLQHLCMACTEAHNSSDTCTKWRLSPKVPCAESRLIIKLERQVLVNLDSILHSSHGVVPAQSLHNALPALLLASINQLSVGSLAETNAQATPDIAARLAHADVWTKHATVHDASSPSESRATPCCCSAVGSAFSHQTGPQARERLKSTTVASRGGKTQFRTTLGKELLMLPPYPQVKFTGLSTHRSSSCELQSAAAATLNGELQQKKPMTAGVLS